MHLMMLGGYTYYKVQKILQILKKRAFDSWYEVCGSSRIKRPLVTYMPSVKHHTLNLTKDLLIRDDPQTSYRESKALFLRICKIFCTLYNLKQSLCLK